MGLISISGDVATYTETLPNNGESNIFTVNLKTGAGVLEHVQGIGGLSPLFTTGRYEILPYDEAAPECGHSTVLIQDNPQTSRKLELFEHTKFKALSVCPICKTAHWTNPFHI